MQALQAAREGIVEAPEKAGGDFEGPAYAEFRYSKDSHLSTAGMKVVRLKGGVGQMKTDVLVTDTGYAEEDSHASDTPPQSGIPGVDPVD